MRILVVSQYFWPENFRINDLVEELVARGNEVWVLTGRPNYPSGKIDPDYKSNPEKYENYMGARIIRLPIVARGTGALSLISNYASYFILGSILGPFKLAKFDFDVIFTVQLSPITIAIPAIVMKVLRKKPMVMWVLDLWPESLLATGVVRNKSILNLIAKLVRFIYARCDLILGQSRSITKEIGSKTGTRVEYYPSWAETIFQSHQVEIDKPAADKKVFEVMFAGNIGESQDFPAILDAAERLKSHPIIRWIIVGSGRNFELLATQVKRRGLSEVVTLLGRRPLEEMPHYFARADLMLVTLKDERIFSLTVPGKIQSYLAAGRPIIGMLNGEGAEVIETSGAGYASPAGDAEGLAKNVHRMYELPKKDREAMGKSGQAYSCKEYNRANLISALEQFFDDVCLAHRKSQR